MCNGGPFNNIQGLPALLRHTGLDGSQCLLFPHQGGQFISFAIMALGHIGSLCGLGDYGIQHFNSFLLGLYIVSCDLL